jgi:hypothetical protein
LQTRRSINAGRRLSTLARRLVQTPVRRCSGARTCKQDARHPVRTLCAERANKPSTPSPSHPKPRPLRAIVPEPIEKTATGPCSTP